MIILLFSDVSKQDQLFSTKINQVLKKRSKEKLFKEIWNHTFHKQ